MSRHLRPYLWLLLAIAAVTAVSFPIDAMNGYDRQIMIMVGINMILAASLNLINGFTGQFSLGHAGFMAIGAYAAAIVTTMIAPDVVGPVEGMGRHAVFLVALLAGGIAAAVAGVLVGIPSLRLRGDYLAIVTLGFGEIIRIVLQNIPEVGGALGIPNIPLYTSFIWIGIVLCILVFVTEMMMRSTYGQGFLAVRDDEIAAESVGINTTRYKVTAFVVGAFFAGIAGGLYGHYLELIRPEDFGFLISVIIVVMVILGGMGSTWGVLLAAALLTYFPEWMRDTKIGSLDLGELRMSLYALLLIILMLTRPQGLFGSFKVPAFIRDRFSTRKQESTPTVE